MDSSKYSFTCFSHSEKCCCFAAIGVITLASAISKGKIDSRILSLPRSWVEGFHFDLISLLKNLILFMKWIMWGVYHEGYWLLLDLRSGTNLWHVSIRESLSSDHEGLMSALLMKQDEKSISIRKSVSPVQSALFQLKSSLGYRLLGEAER